MFFADGNQYEGEFYNDAMHGQGIFFFKVRVRWSLLLLLLLFSNAQDGSRYEGEMVEGRISGNGMYFYKSGATYQVWLRRRLS
jgi:hypothetical protein